MSAGAQGISLNGTPGAAGAAGPAGPAGPIGPAGPQTPPATILLNAQASALGIGNGADATPDILFSYNMPAGTLQAGSVLRIRGSAITTLGGGSTGTLYVFFGTYNSKLQIGATATNGIVIEAIISVADLTHINISSFNVLSGPTGPARSSVDNNVAVPDLSVNPTVISLNGSSSGSTAGQVLAFDFQVWLVG